MPRLILCYLRSTSSLQDSKSNSQQNILKKETEYLCHFSVSSVIPITPSISYSVITYVEPHSQINAS